MVGAITHLYGAVATPVGMEENGGFFVCGRYPPSYSFLLFCFYFDRPTKGKETASRKLFTFFLTCVCVWPLCENREDINFPDRKPPIAGGKGSPLFFSSNPSTKSFFYNISTYCFLLYKYLSETAHMRTEWRISSLQISIVHPPLHLLYIIHPQKWYLTLIIFSHYIKL